MSVIGWLVALIGAAWTAFMLLVVYAGLGLKQRGKRRSVTDNSYTCAECHGTFNKGRSDEEARAEASANGFDNIPAAEMVVVCDECYNAIVERNKYDPRSHFYVGRSS